jgi:hypothetical protein
LAKKNVKNWYKTALKGKKSVLKLDEFFSSQIVDFKEKQRICSRIIPLHFLGWNFARFCTQRNTDRLLSVVGICLGV